MRCSVSRCRLLFCLRYDRCGDGISTARGVCGGHCCTGCRRVFNSSSCYLFYLCLLQGCCPSMIIRVHCLCMHSRHPPSGPRPPPRTVLLHFSRGIITQDDRLRCGCFIFLGVRCFIFTQDYYWSWLLGVGIVRIVPFRRRSAVVWCRLAIRELSKIEVRLAFL